MLNFQTDYDEHTGEQVLTCFLLPQMEYQNAELGEINLSLSCTCVWGGGGAD